MNWRIMGNTASLPRLIVLKRSITYPQTVRNLEQTKEKAWKREGEHVHALKKKRKERGNIKDCILNFIFKRRAISTGFSFEF